MIAWSPVRASTPDDSRLITPETTPPSFPNQPAGNPLKCRNLNQGLHLRPSRIGGRRMLKRHCLAETDSVFNQIGMTEAEHKTLGRCVKALP